MTGRRTVMQVFLWPLVLALVTLCGLLSALLGDGVWDVLSWCLLAVPVAVCAVFASGRQDRRTHPER
ncbi:MAG: hypothetical protein KKD25_06070 [Gammaproteobacteria bacterium]|jgi:hypothetical protein|nr:hypothetical protein [Gammaproteobacteria bacterium]MBU0773327.1 hypothetical protein [Gammaproteobacteria bacterium]MBU0854719.1 hypothetical protein [Gammaproteobacteria bacterium]MBU1846705.1 hypothetical protein [Gammaproteobacteria bacterium]